MDFMAFQNTDNSIVYSTVYQMSTKRKRQSSALLAFCDGFPSQMVSDAESITVKSLI